jgi:hypothetical protein
MTIKENETINKDFRDNNIKKRQIVKESPLKLLLANIIKNHSDERKL